MKSVPTSKTGWRYLAELQVERSPESYKEAILSDIALMKDDPKFTDSLLRVIEMLIKDILSLQDEGMFRTLERYREILAEVFRVNPDLPRLKDLDLAARAGVSLDRLLQNLEVLRTLPTSRRALSLFELDTPDAELLRKIMQCLAKEKEWQTISNIIASTGLNSTRNQLFDALMTLRDNGLIIHDPQGLEHHFRVSVVGHQLWEKLNPTA